MRKGVYVFIGLMMIATAANAGLFDEDVLVQSEQTPMFKLASIGDEGATSISHGLLASSKDEVEASAGIYSPVKEGLMSMLLPGLGAYRMGHKLRSKIYFGIEGITWVAVGSFLWMGYSRENAFKEYAATFAGVSSESYPDDYYRLVGQYISSDGPGGYNEYIRREARDMYYPDKDAMDNYYDQHAYTGSMAWRWRSYNYFRKYNVLREGSESAYRDALYVSIVAVVVRVVSSVDAVMLAKGKEGDKPRVKNISVGMKGNSRRFLLYVNRSF